MERKKNGITLETIALYSAIKSLLILERKSDYVKLYCLVNSGNYIHVEEQTKHPILLEFWQKCVRKKWTIISSKKVLSCYLKNISLKS